MLNPSILSVENLRVDYGDLTAVDDLGFEVESGQIFGLVGPNGAGKTSCIRVIATLLEATYGQVKVCGHDVLENPVEARAQIGYIPDLAPVNPDLRIEEFLEFFDRSYGLPAKGRTERIAEAIEAVGLQAKRGTLAKHLSRGLTQRLVLAKTLLHKPNLLLLDEPASGMDPLARRELRDILRVQARAGRAILISSHILSELEDMCTHVGVMRDGRLKAIGSVDSIGRAANQTVRTILVEVLGDPMALADWLHSHPGVEDIQVQERRVTCSLSGGDVATVALLAGMIERKVPVLRFEPGRQRLEDLLTSLSGKEEEPAL